MIDSEKAKLRRIVKQSSSLAEMLQVCLENEIWDLKTVYKIYKEMEEMTAYFGTFVFDEEVYQNQKIDKTESCYDISSVSSLELRELNRYINHYCNGKNNIKYQMLKFKDGYKAVIPYLLDRRAAKGMYYSVKKKYICSVFENLLRNNEPFARLSSATIIIITFSPFGERVVRDNDNVDSRDVINLINRYMMSTDDSGAFMNIIYDTQKSDDYRTEIYILPKRDVETLI